MFNYHGVDNLAEANEKKCVHRLARLQNNSSEKRKLQTHFIFFVRATVQKQFLSDALFPLLQTSGARQNAKSLFNLKFVRCLPRWFYKNQFLSRLKVPRLTVPVMFLSGTADQLIPPNMATELYNATSSETKQLARFPGGSHNETWMCSHYYQTIEYFLDEVIMNTNNLLK